MRQRKPRAMAKTMWHGTQKQEDKTMQKGTQRTKKRKTLQRKARDKENAERKEQAAFRAPLSAIQSSGSTMLCHAMEWINTGGCALPLPVGQTITSQQSELPGHSRKCRFQFLAVPMEILTSPCSRYGTRKHRSSAATCWTQHRNEGTALHM